MCQATMHGGSPVASHFCADRISTDQEFIRTCAELVSGITHFEVLNFVKHFLLRNISRNLVIGCIYLILGNEFFYN
jgi:hypothetical protein